MVNPRFYSSQPLPRPPADIGEFIANEEISRHVQVLRLGVNDPITLFDGLGGEWQAVITSVGKRHTTWQFLRFDAVERESPLSITLVQALASSDKMDLIVQKAVELGVSAIQPVSSERATLKIAGDRAQKKTAHWRAVAQAACEQCGRNRVPAIAEVISLEAWLAVPPNGSRVMLHPQATKSLIDTANSARPLAIVVGPEGGFSDREIALANTQDVVAVRFGPRTLRTETAGIAALAALHAVHGDLR